MAHVADYGRIRTGHRVVGLVAPVDPSSHHSIVHAEHPVDSPVTANATFSSTGGGDIQFQNSTDTGAGNQRYTHLQT